MADLNLEAIHPRGDGERHLGDGIFAPPADDASRERSDDDPPPRPLRLVMTYGEWKTRGDVEAIPVVVHGDGDVDNAYAGWEVRRHPRIERRPVELVRRRGEADAGDADVVLAVMDVAPNANEKGSIVISSPRPRYEGQMPAGGLHPWAVVTERPTKGNYFKYATEVRTISREAAATGMKMNRADDDDDGEAAASGPHSPTYTVEDVPGPTGPRTVVRRNGRPAAAMEERYGPSGATTVTATVAPGIDPCLIACLAVDRTNRLCIHNRKRSEEECFGEICACFCCPCL